MAILTGQQIYREVQEGRIKIEPFNKAQLNPNSYNLRLGQTLLVYRKNYEAFLERQALPVHVAIVIIGTVSGLAMGPVLGRLEHSVWGFLFLLTGLLVLWWSRRAPMDMAAEEPTVELTIPPEGLVLYPGVLYLGATLEYTETPWHVPTIEGRSGVGRLGICMHITAGFGDRGFCGDWTLEITVVHPIRVYAGVEVCQIVYTDTVGEHLAYTGSYQGQRGPKASRLWKGIRRDQDQKQTQQGDSQEQSW